jgi:flagellar L-ring protein precursor FlgH
VAVQSFFGLETLLPGSINAANLAGLGTSTGFNGSGSTARTGALTGVLTARVEEVLPNGDLVIQGVREIEINGDRQILVVTGVVRPYDINTNNVVPSTAVGQMRIRYFGKGLMKDNLSPSWLVRILNKIF